MDSTASPAQPIPAAAPDDADLRPREPGFRGVIRIGMALGLAPFAIGAIVGDYALYRDARSMLDLPNTDALHPSEEQMQALVDLAESGNNVAISLFQQAGRALDLEPSRFPPRDRFAIQWHRSDPMQSEQRAVSDAEAFARRRGLGRVRQNERRRRTTRALERELGREAALRGKSTQVSVVACSRKLVSVVRPIVRQMRSEGAAIRGSRADGYDNEGSEHNEPFGPEQEQTSDLARRVATVTRARLT